MWKPRNDEPSAHPVPQPSPAAPAAQPSATPVIPRKEVAPVDVFKNSDAARSVNTNDVAHIGRSVLVKGELSGSEDLFLEGQVEGSIELRGHSLVVGPHGRVRANVQARDVVLHGRVEGNVRASDRVELKKTAVLLGDVVTQRIVIEDGAFLKGGVDIQKESAARSEAKHEAAAAAPAPSSPQGTLVSK